MSSRPAESHQLPGRGGLRPSGAFHLVKLAHNTIDTVRRRVQTDTVSQRGRSFRLWSWIRQVLLHGAANRLVAIQGVGARVDAEVRVEVL